MAHFCKCLILSILSILSLSACSPHDENHAQGYIEGRYTYIASGVSGNLEKLNVVRGQTVQKGDLLLTLEHQPESDAYQNALENYKENTAARDAIKANLEFAKLTYDRYKALVPKQAIQQSQLDDAKANYQATLAQLAQAQANIAASQATLAQAKWTLDQKELHAPVSGLVFDTYYREGERTLASEPILALLAPQDIKAIFYVPEKKLSQLKLGQTITVLCDGCPRFNARISFISPIAEYTPPMIYSTETNYKFIFRLEAQFDTKTAKKLHPGQPVTVVLNP